MNPHDSYDAIGTILNIHAMVNGFLAETVEDVPESRMTEQPGTIDNRPAWMLSHLDAYAGVLLSILDDPSVPAADAEMERFLRKSVFRPPSGASIRRARAGMQPDARRRRIRPAASIRRRAIDFKTVTPCRWGRRHY